MRKIFPMICAVILTLGTMSNIQAYTGVPDYFTEDIHEADERWGLVPDGLQDEDLSLTMTRGEFCDVIMAAYVTIEDKKLDQVNSPFSDTNDIEIANAYKLGIVSGYTDGTFRPDAPVKRQELLKMLDNFIHLYQEDYTMTLQQSTQLLNRFKDKETIAPYAVVSIATAYMAGITQGTDEGMMEPLRETSRNEGIIMAKRTLEYMTGSERTRDFSDFWNGDWENDKNGRGGRRGSQGESIQVNVDARNPLYALGNNPAKRELIFGDASISSYESASEASSHMVSITVDVWKMRSSGEKYPGKATFRVHENIAESVQLIFAEIYNGQEQFPIKSIGGYSWRSNGTSEHCFGLAIDINPNENYMINSNGILAGSFWKPGEDPYSILENGDVVNAFKKYGFSWGGNAWRSSNDYMHFSYLGQ